MSSEEGEEEFRVRPTLRHSGVHRLREIKYPPAFDVVEKGVGHGKTTWVEPS